MRAPPGDTPPVALLVLGLAGFAALVAGTRLGGAGGALVRNLACLAVLLAATVFAVLLARRCGGE